MVEEKIVKLSSEIRSFDLGAKFCQPFLLSDSKGYSLRNNCPNKEIPGFRLWCLSGARSREIVDFAETQIQSAINRHKSLFIYAWFGTCDVTKLVDGSKNIDIRCKLGNETLKTVSDQYKRLVAIVHATSGVRLKFVELPTISIAKKNGVRDNQTLLNDKCVDNQIRAINLVVRELNSELSTNTLHFHLECIRCAKAKGKKPRYYTKTTALQDGVHPTKLTSLVWVKRLLLDAKKCCTLQGPFDDELELNVPSDELELL